MRLERQLLFERLCLRTPSIAPAFALEGALAAEFHCAGVK